MSTLLVLTLLIVGADYSTATVGQLREETNAAHKTYSLEKGQELLTALEQRMHTAQGDEDQKIRQMLAENALLVASFLRYEYEQPNTSNVQRRELGKEIDLAAAAGFSALGRLPDTSEKYRIMADLYTMMMRSKHKGSRHEESMEECIGKALLLDENNPKALISRSRRLLFAEEKYGGDFEAGLALVNRALEIAPDDESVYILRGLAYKQHGMTEKAVADWKHALEINPDAKPAREHLEAALAEGK